MPGCEETSRKSSLEPQRKVTGSGMEREGPPPMNDQKRSILVARGWVRKKKKAYRKMIRFSVCASDFSSQRKTTESELRDFSLSILLMPFDGREKIPMCLRIKGRAFNWPALSLSVYTPQVAKSSSNIFAWLSSKKVNTRIVGVSFFLLDHN